MHRTVRRTIGFIACLCSFSSGQAMAASANTSTTGGTVGAQVATPLQLVANAVLRFGAMASPQSAGTITVWPYNAVSTTGGVTAASAIAQPTGQGPAHFNVTGNPGAQFLISGVYQVTISNGSATMTLGQFTTLGTAPIYTLSASGLSDFYIGGTLNVAANQAVGNYSGTFPITVTYY